MRILFSLLCQGTPLVVLTGIALFSCCPGGTSSTQAALSTTEELIGSLNELSKSTQQCEASVTSAVRETQTDLGRLPIAIDSSVGSLDTNDSEIDSPAEPVAVTRISSDGIPRLGGIAGDWEQRWNLVEQQANIIENRFERVAVASKNYWDKVDSITAAINDESLKEREAGKNEVARTAWDEVHERAATQIGKIQKLRSKGQDFLRVMQLAAMREDLGRHADELKAISDDAESILAELQKLSESGKSLIQSDVTRN